MIDVVVIGSPNKLRPLIIDHEARVRIAELMAKADAKPVDMITLNRELNKSPTFKRNHMDQMNDQTMDLGFGYVVTYSIEHGHPVGPCRHISISVDTAGKMPSVESALMIAGEFEFKGSLKDFDGIWIEDLSRDEKGNLYTAINIVQKLDIRGLPKSGPFTSAL